VNDLTKGLNVRIPLLTRRGGRDIKKNVAKPLLLERTGFAYTDSCA